VAAIPSCEEKGIGEPTEEKSKKMSGLPTSLKIKRLGLEKKRRVKGGDGVKKYKIK